MVAVFTHQDIDASGVGGVPCGWLITDRHGQPMKEPQHPILAAGKVRHVGDPIVAVIAETPEQAKDAAELVKLDLQELPAVVDMPRALQGGGRRCTTKRRTISATTGSSATRPRPMPRSRRAAHVTKLDLINNRLMPNAMEPRAAIGEYDLATGDYTLYTTSQNPHVIRLLMGAFVLQHSGAQAAGRCAGRRRRLRLEDLPLCRGSVRHLGHAPALGGR